MNCTEQIKHKIKKTDRDKLEKLYEELIKKYSGDTIKMWFYFYHNYTYEDKLSFEERIKRNDAKFKEQIKNKYNNQCIITKKPLKYCQIAHIYPFSLSSESEKYDVNNGLLLCSDIHIGFDSEDNDFFINPENLSLEISQNIINDPTMEAYHKYNNLDLKSILSEGNIKYLKKKYNLL